MGPTEQWPTRSEVSLSLLKDPSTSVHNKGKYVISEIRHGYQFPLAWIRISEHTAGLKDFLLICIVLKISKMVHTIYFWNWK